MPPQHSSAWLSSAQLGIFTLHRSPQLCSAHMTWLSTAQLSSASFSLAWLGAHDRQSFLGASSSAWWEGAFPACCQGQDQCHQHPHPARTVGAQGTVSPRAPPPLLSPLTGWCPWTCSSAGEAPYGHHMATFHPGPSVVSSHASISPCAGSRQVRWNSFPSVPKPLLHHPALHLPPGADSTLPTQQYCGAAAW